MLVMEADNATDTTLAKEMGSQSAQKTFRADWATKTQGTSGQGGGGGTDTLAQWEELRKAIAGAKIKDVEFMIDGVAGDGASMPGAISVTIPDEAGVYGVPCDALMDTRTALSQALMFALFVVVGLVCELPDKTQGSVPTGAREKRVEGPKDRKAAGRDVREALRNARANFGKAASSVGDAGKATGRWFGAARKSASGHPGDDAPEQKGGGVNELLEYATALQNDMKTVEGKVPGAQRKAWDTVKGAVRNYRHGRLPMFGSVKFAHGFIVDVVARAAKEWADSGGHQEKPRIDRLSLAEAVVNATIPLATTGLLATLGEDVSADTSIRCSAAGVRELQAAAQQSVGGGKRRARTCRQRRKRKRRRAPQTPRR